METCKSSVKAHETRVDGYNTRFYCCQDADHKKKIKKSIKENVKHRDNLGMDRFSCDSHLSITIQLVGTSRQAITVRLEHGTHHVPYYDVALLDEVATMIKENLHLIPSILAQTIQKKYPQVTAQQVYRTWAVFSETQWKRNDNQYTSAETLLHEMENDVDIFPIEAPSGVTALAWGVHKLAELVKQEVVEVAIDATCEFD
jgi:hypothetical protein